MKQGSRIVGAQDLQSEWMCPNAVLSVSMIVAHLEASFAQDELPWKPKLNLFLQFF